MIVAVSSLCMYVWNRCIAPLLYDTSWMLWNLYSVSFYLCRPYWSFSRNLWTQWDLNWNSELMTSVVVIHQQQVLYGILSGEANGFHLARAAVSTDVILLKANDKLCMSSLLHLWYDVWFHNQFASGGLLSLWKTEILNQCWTDPTNRWQVHKSVWHLGP
jgi:hypothetical protein